jgi:hypothetical protein
MTNRIIWFFRLAKFGHQHKVLDCKDIDQENDRWIQWTKVLNCKHIEHANARWIPPPGRREHIGHYSAAHGDEAF